MRTVQHDHRVRHLTGLLSAMIPPGTIMLPNNRRVRTLSAYDRRKRYLTGLGDDSDSDPFSDIDSSDLSQLYYGGGVATSYSAPTPATNLYSTPVAPTINTSPAYEYGASPTGIIQQTGLPTYLPPSINTPNVGPVAAGSTITPSGSVATILPSGQQTAGLISAIAGVTGATTTLPSGQVVPATISASSLSQWLSQSSIIGGISNGTLLLVGGIAVLLGSSKKKKK